MAFPINTQIDKQQHKMKINKNAYGTYFFFIMCRAKFNCVTFSFFGVFGISTSYLFMHLHFSNPRGKKFLLFVFLSQIAKYKKEEQT